MVVVSLEISNSEDKVDNYSGSCNPYIYICGTGFWGLFRSPGYIRPPSISPAPTIQPFSCAMPCMAIKH